MNSNPTSIFNFGLLHLEWSTALFVFCAFIIVTIGLHFLLFAPILKTFQNRELDQNAKYKKSESLKNSISISQQEYQKEIEKVKNEIKDIQKENETLALKKAQEILTSAQTETKKQINDSAQEFKNALDTENKKTSKLAKNLSHQLQLKILK